MFVLVEVIEREISVGKFDTLESAQSEMLKRFKSYGGDELIDEDEADIGATSAWVNADDGDLNCDWSIEEL